ncbi:hypothetical protein KVT40_003411 [Elsinoe batatas]|uniref:Uncharacterized protein n=1 Tax=Elsinoe batatas TaxID=2601811 RepID=A0A8K0L441_9PEZI|nr:hypothetical protein KVT40_003411 [Elsinoe batatas]
MHRFLPIAFFAIAASAQLTEVPSDAFASAIVVIGSAVQAGTNGTTSLPVTSATSSSPAEDTTKAIDAIIRGVRAGSNAAETSAEIIASPTTTLTTPTAIATSAQSSAAASQAGNSQGMVGAAPSSGRQEAGLAAALAIGVLAFAV